MPPSILVRDLLAVAAFVLERHLEACVEERDLAQRLFRTSKLKSVMVKISASGLKVTFVPVLLLVPIA